VDRFIGVALEDELTPGGKLRCPNEIIGYFKRGSPANLRVRHSLCIHLKQGDVAYIWIREVRGVEARPSLQREKLVVWKATIDTCPFDVQTVETMERGQYKELPAVSHGKARATKEWVLLIRITEH
jgi:hypothetical protein